MKSRNLFAIVLVLAMVLLTGCGTTYEDTNGDDNYSLETLTDDNFFGSYSCTASGTVSKVILGVYKETCKEFNGVTNIADLSDLTYSSSNAQLTISFHINSGNGKLVICDNEKIIDVVEINKDDQVFNFDASGFVYLRLAGESLNYEIEYMLGY